MIYTYHHLVEGCPRGEERAWREFVTQYLPLARHFLFQYFPSLSTESPRRLAQVFAGTLEGDGQFFRSFTGRTERELMVHFRNFVIERLRGLAALPASAAPAVTLEVLETALKDLSALQRQVVWLFALGYSPEKLAPILNMKPLTAAEIVRTAQEKLRTAMGAWSEDSLPSSGAALVEAVSSRETADCYPYLTFHRLVDGQITWRERELALVHLTRCFRCVDRFCTFQEVVYFSRRLPAACPQEIEAILRGLGLAPVAKKKSLLAKLFG